tara:strand:+ start:279 stop:2054 length:1776 start_codon:yes stop_codon:yes gene_type:complete
MLRFNHSSLGSVVIRPVPFVSISASPIRNKTNHLGSEYTITLTGTLVPQRGSPDANGNFQGYDPSNAVAINERADAIFQKQNALRKLFADDGLQIEIESPGGGNTIVANVTLESINFEEGTYVTRCGYTVTLKTTHLNDQNGNMLYDSLPRIKELTTSDSSAYKDTGAYNFASFESTYGGLVEDFNEEWSIEVDDSLGETSNDNPFDKTLRTYIITRTSSATGRTVYDSPGNPGNANSVKREAWESAKKFLLKVVVGDSNLAQGIPDDVPNSYPDYQNTFSDQSGGTLNYGDLLLGLDPEYQAYNHSRSETINKSAGSFSITDKWVLLKDTAYENFDVSIESSNSEPFNTFNINGTIKGVTSHSAKSMLYGGTHNQSAKNTPAANALIKYNKVTNNGRFDVNSYVYKRVAALTTLAINPQPLSVSVSRNDFTGEITYQLSYDNRPLNVIAEALSETITIDDTYPGDVYTAVPVIGRATGPVLQYMGTRTEYRRSISIDLQFDYTDIDRYTPATITQSNKATQIINTRSSLLMSKPTRIEPVRTQINNLVQSLSPLNEPNIRKCFVDAPTENWEPRTGRYNLSISWIYELSE